MICDNCGSEIDKNERYCPDCGMELPGPRPKPSKKKYYKNSRQSNRNNRYSDENYENYHNEEHNYEKKQLNRKYKESNYAQNIPNPHADYSNYNEKEDYKRKPLKRKYYGNPSASAQYDSHYPEETGYESYHENKTTKKKSGIGLGTICLLMVMILLFGFVIGLILFSSPQSIPQIPGINS